MVGLPVKIDLHVHTCYSEDSNVSLRDLFLEIRRKGLDGVAITDHDNIKGSLEACKIALGLEAEKRPIIIPGIEVSAREGHIIGLNIIEPIPKGLSVEETVERIHEGGGIAIAAHPQAFFKDGIKLSPRILSLGLDAIEVINSSFFPFRLHVKACEKFAKQHNLPQTAGSDSHIVEAIGLAYTLINTEERSVDSIIKTIKKGLIKPLGTGMPFSLRIRNIFK